MMAFILLFGLVVLPFVASQLVGLASGVSRRAAALSAGAAMLGGLLILAGLAPTVFAGEVLVVTLPWLPEWGLDLSLRLDGLGLLFVLLIDGIGLLIVLYAYYYMEDDDQLGRFYLYLLAFAGGMLGLVLAENLLLMLLFWEITSLTSFLLVAYKFKDKEARIAARMALGVTGAGGLALMAGLILLGQMAGSYALSDVLLAGDTIRADPRYPLMLVLVLLGAFTKSAQFPFHSWLPGAMAAPTPASAYLHSATMVKAGVFLLARLYPALSGTDLWFYIVTGVGAVTFLFGAFFALLRHDFKGLLAYSTISHLGLIVLLLGLSTPMAPVAAVFHIINHAVFKASLFMVAGIVDHEAGTRDMRRLSGLRRTMPRTTTLAVLAAGAMAGVPFLNGFLSKEMFFAESIGLPGALAWAMPAIATIGGVLAVGYSARFIADVFLGPPPTTLDRIPHEPPRFMRVPVEILVGIVVVVGLLPQLAVKPLLAIASTAVLGAPVPPLDLAIWHGFNLPLIMSIVALGGGLYYFSRREIVFRIADRFGDGISSRVAFERFYNGLAIGSRAVLAAIDGFSLRQNLALFLLFTLVLGLSAWWGAGNALLGPLGVGDMDVATMFAAATMLAAVAGVVVLHRQRLVALVALSLAGVVVALLFVWAAAPDLALTQLSVEVASIILLLLMMRFLPIDATPETGAAATREAARRLPDAAIALAAGAGAGALVLAMLSRPFDTISAWHIANSVDGGGGTNIVNVILVDFRGFDTMGEVAVLGMAALGIQAMLGGIALPGRVARGADGRSLAPPVMLKMLVQPLLPLLLAAAVFIFLRGHNMPGGGFVAGLIVAVALVMQFVARGIAFAEARLRQDMTRVLGVGLAICLITGLVPLAFGRNFLTSTHGYLAGLHLASAALFDLGIMIVVVASLVLALVSLGRLSQASER
ncbi:monovalent cation/H+ antiporter subunit A [Polymorphobacter multimanifer]|uniref:monovalent cation/H+ antiporter subunit A n=1 Tax=Polymorphobacter multimanifer TaxID=1070431 RepID=UPI001987F064|nr:monovalent cation/H+ antiporter subunit A [Polymorphobacter multimanifer]GGI79854.1 monovalent cation/H+ antiporter subunit A [Polymorphobacter multimanifer]